MATKRRAVSWALGQALQGGRRQSHLATEPGALLKLGVVERLGCCR